MKTSIIRSGLAVLALSAVLIPATGLTAQANTTSTRNIVYGAVAAAAVLALYNTEHKHQIASTVQGHLSDGSTVYQDGHVVSTNGQSWYPSQYGQTVACSNQYCTIQGNNSGNNGYGYNNNGNGYNPGNTYNGYNNPGNTYNGYNPGNTYNGYNNPGNTYNGYNNPGNTYNGYDAKRYNNNGRTSDNAHRRGHQSPQ